MASVSTASWLGFACTSTPRSIRPSGSTSGLYHQYGVKGAMCNWHWSERRRRRCSRRTPTSSRQASACFIQSVGDNMEDIMELARSEAMLFKFGSGTGTDLSTLRSHREKLSGGGRPSGPLSFMRVYDQIAAVVKSGGKTRRAAKMQSMKVWHPDVLEFIECKNREEKKARTLVEQGYDPQDAYDTVLFQNANLSVRLSDEFMRNGRDGQALDDALGDRAGQGRSDLPGPRNVRQDGQFGLVLRRSRACSTTRPSTAGTPAPTPAGSTPATPAREYMFLDDSACNLASINLMKFRRERRQVRRRAFPGGLPAGVHRPGDPGRSRQLSDAADRRQQPSFPADRTGLLEPGQPDHGQRPALRFGRGPRAVRRDHGAAARGGLPHQHRVGRGGRAVRRPTRRTARRCCA